MRRLAHLVICDLRVGLASMGWVLIGIFALGLFSAAELDGILRVLKGADLLAAPGVRTFGGYLAYALAGARPITFEVVATRGELPSLPMGWLLVVLLIAYVTLAFPRCSIEGSGQLLVLKAGGRWCWWLAKCLWVVACVLLGWLSFLVGLSLWTCLARADLSLSVSTVVGDVAFGGGVALDGPASVGSLMAALVPVSAGLSLLQLAVCLVLGSTAGFATTVSLLFASALADAPWLAGGYLMAVRSAGIATGGLSLSGALVCSILHAALGAGVGGMLFSRSDLIRRRRA